jgi:hypothetical protein
MCNPNLKVNISGIFPPQRSHIFPNLLGFLGFKLSAAYFKYPLLSYLVITFTTSRQKLFYSSRILSFKTSEKAIFKEFEEQ